MRRALTVALALAVAAVALWGIDRFAIASWESSRVVQRVETRTMTLYNARDPLRYAPLIREQIISTRIARHRDPVNIDLYMDEAANLRLLSLWDDAAQLYEEALHIDRRPEIYFNLAIVELARGRRDAAKENFIRACKYNPVLYASIDDEALRQEVKDAYLAYRGETR